MTGDKAIQVLRFVQSSQKKLCLKVRNWNVVEVNKKKVLILSNLEYMKKYDKSMTNISPLLTEAHMTLSDISELLMWKFYLNNWF